MDRRPRAKAAERLILRICEAYMDQKFAKATVELNPTPKNKEELWKAQMKFNKRRNRLFNIIMQSPVELEPPTDT